mgnify:CR=1
LSVLRPKQLAIPYFSEEKVISTLALNDKYFSPLGRVISHIFE